jgi:hypothetical protein
MKPVAASRAPLDGGYGVDGAQRGNARRRVIGHLGATLMSRRPHKSLRLRMGNRLQLARTSSVSDCVRSSPENHYFQASGRWRRAQPGDLGVETKPDRRRRREQLNVPPRTLRDVAIAAEVSTAWPRGAHVRRPTSQDLKDQVERAALELLRPQCSGAGVAGHPRRPSAWCPGGLDDPVAMAILDVMAHQWPQDLALLITPGPHPGRNLKTGELIGRGWRSSCSATAPTSHPVEEVRTNRAPGRGSTPPTAIKTWTRADSNAGVCACDTLPRESGPPARCALGADGGRHAAATRGSWQDNIR